MMMIDLWNKIALGEIENNTYFKWYYGDLVKDIYYDENEEDQLCCLKNVDDNLPIKGEGLRLDDEVEINTDRIAVPIAEYKRLLDIEKEYEKIKDNPPQRIVIHTTSFPPQHEQKYPKITWGVDN